MELRMHTIVVGVDGSDTSKDALDWAAGEAKLRGAKLVALHAWSYPAVSGGPFGMAVPPLDIDFEKEARAALEKVLAGAGLGESSNIRHEIVRGPAAQVLIGASKTADLLVIGSRGLGGFSGLLLGSVGHQCTQHAACPVVVVPHAERVNAD
jgi:nucleotide-binding universal stress UspA family protein